MLPETTEYIYRAYQPKQYYTQYFKKSNLRPDGRQLQEHRPIRANVSFNSVVITRGNTTVIVQLKTDVEAVVYSPISHSYGKQLIKIAVSAPNAGKFQRNACRAVERYVQQFIEWRGIEQQIVKESQKQMLGHSGQITVIVADSDGCLQETALIAVQILLWTAHFESISPGSKSKQFFMLKLEEFWFPIKYCEIINELVIDPTFSEEKNSQYEITLLTNLYNKQSILKIQHLHSCIELPKQVILSLEKLYSTQISKLPLDMIGLAKKIEKESEGKFWIGSMTIHIQGL